VVVEWFGLQFLRLESMEGGDVISKTRTISTLRAAQVGTAQALDHYVQLIFELDNGDGRSRKKIWLRDSPGPPRVVDRLRQFIAGTSPGHVPVRALFRSISLHFRRD
jgi:hypothetical protein